MFFTQEDYRKIEKWLLANSVKDTEFAGASLPLKGNETVAFVQDGKNVNVFLKDLIEQIFLLGVSDFLNVTDKYGESRISLTQAIQLIPYKSRKIGQVITFLDEDGEWKLFQFQGERVNQWNNATLWVDLIKRTQGISIIDSEDITATVDNLNQTSLTFADKNYNTADYSGLGRVYLRKNIQRVQNSNTGAFYNTNLLTQQMMTKENTIYIIQYDYSLNFQTITIPDNSVLLFEGGSISNGTINGTETMVNNGRNSVVFTEVVLLGSWRNNFVSSSWFATYNEQALRNIMNLSNSNVLTNVSISKNDIFIKGFKDTTEDKFWATIYDSIQVPSNTVIDFNGGTLRVAPNSRGNYLVLCVYNSNNVTIKNLNIIGDSTEHTGSTGEFGFGISVIGGENVVIDNCYISKMWGDGLFLDSIYDVSTQEKLLKNTSCVINNVVCDDNRRQGLSILSAYDTVIKNSSFINTGNSIFTAPGAGIDIEPENANIHLCESIIIDNCIFYNNKNKYDISLGHKLSQPSMIKNCSIINCTIKGLLLQKNTNTTLSNCVVNSVAVRIHTCENVSILNNIINAPFGLIGQVTGLMDSNTVKVNYGVSGSEFFDIYVFFLNEGCDADNYIIQNNNFTLIGGTTVKEFFYFLDSSITGPKFYNNTVLIDNFRYRLRVTNEFKDNIIQLSGNLFLDKLGKSTYNVENNIFKSLPKNYMTLYTGSKFIGGDEIILRGNKFYQDISTHDIFSETANTDVIIRDFSNQVNDLPINYMYGNILNWNITPLYDNHQPTTLMHKIQFDDNGKAYFKGASGSADINSDGTLASKVVII